MMAREGSPSPSILSFFEYATGSWMVILAMGLLWSTVIFQLQVEWSINPQYNYGWFVPILALVLFAKKWKCRPPEKRHWNRLLEAAVILASAFLFPIRLLQESNPDWRLVSWTLTGTAVFLTACLLFYWGGWRWAGRFSFSLGFILIAVPWPSIMEQLLIQGLTRWNAAVVVDAMNWLGHPALQAGNLIEIAGQVIGIDEACSGVRSFQGTLMAALFVGELYDLAWCRRLSLLLGGAAIAFAGNLCRTFALVWIARTAGTTAFLRWHDSAGWTVMLISASTLWMTALHWRRDPLPATPATHREIPRVPIQIILGFCAWMGLVELGTQAWYRQHETGLIAEEKWSVQFPRSNPSYQMIPDQLHAVLRYDTIEAAEWKGEENTEWLAYFIRWNPGRAAVQLARNHRPEVCLPSTGRSLEADLGVEKIQEGSVSLPFRCYLFREDGHPLFVFYCISDNWVHAQLELPQDEDWSARSRLKAMWTGRRHWGQQVLQIAIRNGRSREQALRLLHQELRQIIRIEDKGRTTNPPSVTPAS